MFSLGVCQKCVEGAAASIEFTTLTMMRSDLQEVPAPSWEMELKASRCRQAEMRKIRRSSAQRKATMPAKIITVTNKK